MNKRAFGKTGFEVTAIGFGAAPVAYLAADQERAAKAISQLLDAGVSLIDTAASYPGSESFLGQRFSHRRSEFVLVSKCGHRISESNSGPWEAQTITATVDRALRQLRTDHVDVMLLHSCDMKVLQKGEALGVLAKRPIANSAWREALPGMYANYAKVYIDRLKEMKLDPAALGISGPAQTAWPELALRFTLSQKGVHTAIIGTTNPENAAANIAYAEKGPLPEDVVKKIRRAFKMADPEGKWKGQT